MAKSTKMPSGKAPKTAKVKGSYTTGAVAGRPGKSMPQQPMPGPGIGGKKGK